MKNETISKIILKYVVFFALIFVSAVVQTSLLKIFDIIPAFVLSIIVAIGFIFGERYGGVCGIFGGFVLDALGGGMFSLTPVFFMICGYVAGVMIKNFLSKNFVSFLVYCLIFGGAKGVLTLFYYLLIVGDFNLFGVMGGVVVPEFFGFLVVAPVGYFLVKGTGRAIKN